ncbi:DMT family transporter [Faucicola atlantae]|uniref:DMT family transporter n=1 Tax=Faucicola atlantae TaxID=34059 RepID=UPI0025AF7726|nr:SMR family transporter [Moraxella atlantae]
MSIALKKIEVGIGYAVWAGIGAVGAVIFGGLLLDQPVTPEQAFWLAIIIFGVIGLKLADG